MKRLAFLLLVLICFTACRKIWDKIHDGNEQPTSPSCRVVGWTYGEFNTREGTVPIFTSILYDSIGNPISIQAEDYATNPNATNDRFEYDSQNRLIYNYRPIGEYSKYVYQGNKTYPILDSTFLRSDVYVSHYEYDAEKRITGRSTYLARTSQGPVANSDTTVVNYYYDANGNRQTVGQPLIEYNTSKFSIISLHPTWKLIFANYSVNCTTAAISFNEHGLPLKFSTLATDPLYSQQFYGCVYNNDGVGYECSATN